ncbi:hypothetical protein [Botrimarina sp.]|uniref:hypothetical protein n=1 Tax=Botrimarina sp. TaxID=2795802 RepID=UPI0032EA9501
MATRADIAEAFRSGWTVETEFDALQYRSDQFACWFCDKQNLRWVRQMRHPRLDGFVYAGRCCAEKYAAGYHGEEADRMMRNADNRFKRFADPRYWKPAASSGNLTRMYKAADGTRYRCTILQKFSYKVIAWTAPKNATPRQVVDTEWTSSLEKALRETFAELEGKVTA